MSGVGPEASTKEPPKPGPVGPVGESSSVSLSKNASWSKSNSKKSGDKHKQKKAGASDAGAVELLEGDDAFQGVPEYLTAKWDPCDLNEGEQMNTPSPACIRRIKNDILAIYSDPPPGLCVVPDPNNITKIHALLTGPFDTPYEGGFFYFLIRFPPDYPINPPRVRLMTTGGGTVRFNPNLYKSGKVCLSILGTWAGPSWSPAQTLSTVLISIQSLMNEKPYHNEPGFKHERTSGDAKHYNDIIQHEAIRVAVCDMIEGNCRMPDSLRVVMESSFPDYYRYYLQVCENHLQLDGMSMHDPFGDSRPRFDFKSLLRRLKAIHARLDRNVEDYDEDEDGGDIGDMKDLAVGEYQERSDEEDDEEEEEEEEAERQKCLGGEGTSRGGGGGDKGSGGSSS